MIMKRVVLLSAIILLLSSTAWSKGTANVANTPHNLSTSAPFAYNYYADDVSEVCVFCHTPHGGILAAPLWNHSMPAAVGFTHYNSVTLSNEVQTLSTLRKVNDESLVCMACHDGSVAVDHLINDPNSIGGIEITMGGGDIDTWIVPVGTLPKARIGGSVATPGGNSDLSDDHPISFSYTKVYDEYEAGSTRVGQLNSAFDAVTNGVRFFGADDNLECSSCHDPHVDFTIASQTAYAPFLITPNTGSALCLACHNK